MTEAWVPIPGFEGVYEVSDLGKVRSLDRRVWSSRGFWANVKGRMIATAELPSGHLHLCLKHGGEKANRQVHRLVLEAFTGPCPDGMEACHNDGDPSNNALANLRWDTRSSNMQDTVRHGTHASTRKTHCAKGHPYSPDNTRLAADGRSRKCRACCREYSRAAYLKTLEATS